MDTFPVGRGALIVQGTEEGYPLLALCTKAKTQDFPPTEQLSRGSPARRGASSQTRRGREPSSSYPLPSPHPSGEKEELHVPLRLSPKLELVCDRCVAPSGAPLGRLFAR